MMVVRLMMVRVRLMMMRMRVTCFTLSTWVSGWMLGWKTEFSNTILGTSPSG